jgi:hypothetical protein
VASDTATVSVSFAANINATPKTYIVSIASGSAVIKGGATVSITQAAKLEAAGVKVIFGGLPTDETVNLTKPEDTLSWVANDTLTVSVSNTFTEYTWYVDGILLAGETRNSVTLYAQNYSLGRHTVSVRVSTTSGSYSKTARFTIAQ